MEFCLEQIDTDLPSRFPWPGQSTQPCCCGCWLFTVVSCSKEFPKCHRSHQKIISTETQHTANYSMAQCRTNSAAPCDIQLRLVSRIHTFAQFLYLPHLLLSHLIDCFESNNPSLNICYLTPKFPTSGSTSQSFTQDNIHLHFSFWIKNNLHFLIWTNHQKASLLRLTEIALNS